MVDKSQSIAIFQRIADEGREGGLNPKNRAIYNRFVAEGLVKSQRQPPDYELIFQEKPGDSGAVADLLRSAATGAVVNVGGGLNQMLLQGAEKVGLVDQETVDNFSGVMRDIKKESQRRSSDSPVASFVGEIGGEMLADPKKSIVKQTDKLVTKIGKEFVEQGAIEGAKLTDEGESRLGQAATGGAAGGITRGITSGAGYVGREIIGESVKDFSVEMKRLAQDKSIPLTVGELRNSPTLQKIEGFLDKVPLFGTGSFRQKQLDAFEQTAKEMKIRIGGKVDDVGETITQSLRRRKTIVKREAGKLFDEVEKTIEKNGGGMVEMTSTQKAANDLLELAKQNEDVLPEPDDIVFVKRFIDAKPRTYSDARALRGKILDMKRKAEKGVVTGATSQEDVAFYAKLASALDDDMRVLAKERGAESQWRQANAYFKANVLPLRRGQIGKSFMEDYNSDNLINAYIKRDKSLGSTKRSARELLKHLDHEGQEAVKFAVLTDAWEYASKDQRFNPRAFSRRLAALSDANEVIFSPQELSELRGFQTLTVLANNAEAYAKNADQIGMLDNRALTTTGIAIGSILGSGSDNPLIQSAATGGVTILGGMKGASLLLTSDTGRKLLTRLSEEPTPKVLELINREIAHTLSKIAAISATD